LRNVADKLPDDLAATVAKKMRAAYHAPTAIIAEAQLEALARELEHTHPGAAGSLREGLAETLTVLRLGVPPTLARTLRSTNCIESMISICRNQATCTCQCCEPRSSGMSPRRVSVPNVMMRP